MRENPLPRGPLARFWASDYGLHILLIVLLVMMFVAPGLVAARVVHPLTIHLFFVLTVVSGVVTVARRGSVSFLVLLFAAVTIVVRVTEVSAGQTTVTVVDSVLSLGMVAILVVLILAQVFREGPITVPRIEGAVAVYLLIGLLWGVAYRLVHLLVPNAFSITAGQLNDPMTLYYFSFVTLTTIGYGDILPVAPAARGLAAMEGLVGQLYPAVLIARLVSQQLHAAHERDRLEPPGNA